MSFLIYMCVLFIYSYLVFILLGLTYKCLQCMNIPDTCVSIAEVSNDLGILFLCQIGSLVYVSEMS